MHDDFSFRIETLQNEKTGELMDIVKRDYSIAEVLPYRVEDDGSLKIYLHKDVVRSLANSTPRTGQNIDRHRYSGHMIECLTVDRNSIPEDITPHSSDSFAQDHLNLRPIDGASLETGPSYYPAPDFIEENIQCFYLNVKPRQNKKNASLVPVKKFLALYRFTKKGYVCKFDAQQVLDAIAVGMLPNARLEMQILSLYERLKIKPENWLQSDINFLKSKIETPDYDADTLPSLAEAEMS